MTLIHETSVLGKNQLTGKIMERLLTQVCNLTISRPNKDKIFHPSQGAQQLQVEIKFYRFKG